MSAVAKFIREKNIRLLIFDFLENRASSIASTNHGIINSFGGEKKALKCLLRYGYQVGVVTSSDRGQELKQFSNELETENSFHELYLNYANEGNTAESIKDLAFRANIPLENSCFISQKEYPKDVLQELRMRGGYAWLDGRGGESTGSLLSAETCSMGTFDHIVEDILQVDDCFDENLRRFGPYTIRESEIFVESKHSMGLVNLKPIVAGHVLILSKRLVPRVEQLGAEELSDIWITAQRVGKTIQKHYGATALNFAIQDGKEAGQTVPHVHVHIIPRMVADFEENDQVYEELEKNDQRRDRRHFAPDSERILRTPEQMAEEAQVFRNLLHT